MRKLNDDGPSNSAQLLASEQSSVTNIFYRLGHLFV
jgi:hypothetical protein